MTKQHEKSTDPDSRARESYTLPQLQVFGALPDLTQANSTVSAGDWMGGSWSTLLGPEPTEEI